MSNSIVASLNDENVIKPPGSVKYAVTKTTTQVVQNPSLLLLTVQYPQNGFSKNNKPSISSAGLSSCNTSQPSFAQKAETPYSLLQLNQPVMKNVLYYGAHTQPNDTNKPVSNYNSMLLLKNDDHCQEDMTITKGSFSQNTDPNNFVVAPFPKSVVCTVMPRENKESILSETEIPPQNIICSEAEAEVLKPDEWEECSSGEEEAVQIICDKPVVCRAVASLPAKFLYFGKESEPSQGVCAKKEIPKRAQFGPMEGILHRFPSSSKHHLELTIENNSEIEWLDVSNENISNWMKYVRQAESIDEQNLSLHQIGRNLYFRALSTISPHEELKVWYSMAYAKSRNLPLLSSVKNKKAKKGNKSNTNLSEKENVSVSSKAVKDGEVSKWRCSHCHKVFRSATPFNLHVLTHAADNLETKENHNTNNQTQSSDLLESSVCDKRNKNPLSCYKCKKTFLSNSALACHVKSHASIHTYDCPICKEIFYKVLHLKQHIKSHAINGNFSCPFCSKKYHEYRHIRNHIRRFHCEKNYGCLQCSKRFSTLDKLKLHMLSHSDHREFTCATCGKQFKRKDKLSVHMRRIHLSLKSKAQSTETSSTTDKSLSPQNGVIATDYSDYIYKCHICMLGFKRRGMLVNHLANRHPEVAPDSVPELNLPILKANRDYYCQYCDKIYKSSSKRKAHILKNHPGKQLPPSNAQISPSKKGVENGTLSQTVGSVTTHPQSCDWCHKQYASKAKLLQHQRKNHLNQLPKSLQYPKKSARIIAEEDSDAIRDAIEKVIETDIFLPETLDISEYEASAGDNKFFSGGEFIIDASTLKRAIKGEVLSADCSPETLSELGQIIDARPDGYFKVYQAPSGITLAHPVEVWDPFQLCLSPEATPVLSSS